MPPSRPAPATRLPVAFARGGIVCRPALFQRLSDAGRVVEISAPAGSGKTYLVRSWIEEGGLADRVAWVSVGRQERDAQRFWISVGDALRQTDPGSKVVRGLTAAPELDCWAVVEQLIEDVAALAERTWLVVDDLHELSSNEALRQLELVLMRARWVIQLRLLEANAQAALGDIGAAERSLEQALELGEPDDVRYPFVVYADPNLLKRQSLDVTSHPALLSAVLDLVSGKTPRKATGEPQPLGHPLTESETRVLRYLPTNLSSPEIAGELHLSANTVKTHIRHLYEKLGARSRREAVERARLLGLLARSRRS